MYYLNRVFYASDTELKFLLYNPLLCEKGSIVIDQDDFDASLFFRGDSLGALKFELYRNDTKSYVFVDYRVLLNLANNEALSGVAFSESCVMVYVMTPDLEKILGFFKDYNVLEYIWNLGSHYSFIITDTNFIQFVRGNTRVKSFDFSGDSEILNKLLVKWTMLNTRHSLGMYESLMTSLEGINLDFLR